MPRTSLFVCAAALLRVACAVAAPDTNPVIELRVDSAHPGPTIDRNIFGQFAEHLGNGIYGGIWVGKDSSIPNVRGIRSDVVAALRALHVPNIRWPGGCFADEYHWRDGIGPAASRKATVNANWGGAIEPNSFGTDEYMDFIKQIGSEAYISVNVGSGTVSEAAAWMAYMTADQATSGVGEYTLLLKDTLNMEGLIARHSQIMDHYDPQKKISLVVDEWGAWLAPLPGSNPGFLVQQNSLRDAILAALNLDIFARHADRVRMANIAQMVNVLQAMIMTDHERMVLTPTYYVFRMYTPFQDATLIPVQVEAGAQSASELERVDAIAARDEQGRIWLGAVNLDPERPVRIHASFTGIPVRGAHGQVLTAARVDSINTFDSPHVVQPVPIDGKAVGGGLLLDLPAKSVSVLQVR